MAKLTDPAEELAKIAAKLNKGSAFAGAKFFAECFDVEISSTEFYTIISTILLRCDRVATLIGRSEWEKSQKASAVAELKGFKKAFDVKSLTTNWNNNPDGGLPQVRDHGKVIQFWSYEVRKFESYPSLSEEDVAELRVLITNYLIALRENDEVEAFVKQAIIDGLSRLEFSLNYLGWLGAGYNLDAFKNVLAQYQFLNEQSERRPDGFDPSEALGGLLGILKSMKEKYDSAKSWADTGSSMFESYKLASAYLTPLLLTYQSAQ
ncbi:hypothetical protein GRI69_15515 [Erythrobacter vulgaris]|uniref:Uncharacterized protein n=1 Tax=Qipengyuania vulgaris TaxID=291985 RepID=A0A844XWB9_9SPHN|nr:hypothetical protein [Qipengyuania vulgaris]MXO49659.1 hypothetical protein [Qipengyuania vulgaris]